jgi:hypothetical protein
MTIFGESVDWTAFVVFVAFFLLVTVMGFLGRRSGAPR